MALRSDYQSTVALEEEIQFKRDYLAIEQVRFGDRMLVQYDIAEETRDLQIPSLLLQPLVENAVKHGISGSLQGLISVTSRMHDSRLVCTVQDSGPRSECRPDGFGVGLTATKQRPDRIYGMDHTLLFRYLPQGGVGVSISLPAQERNDDDTSSAPVMPPQAALRDRDHAPSTC